MQTAAFTRFIKLPVSSYLALRGIVHCYKADVSPSIDVEMRRNGLMFLALNVVDEMKTIISKGGMDEHIHHTMCILVSYVNLRLFVRSTDSILKTMMIESFNTLLANEIVAPAFAIYSMLSKWKSHQRHVFKKYALCIIAPILVFRSLNSAKLVSRLMNYNTSEINTHAFKYSTITLSMCLMVLDIIWLNWVKIKFFKKLPNQH